MCATLGVGASRFFINPFYTIGMPVIIVSVLKAPEYAYGISQTFVMVGVLASPMLVMFLKKRHSDATSLFISRIGKVIPFSILLIVGFEGVRNALKSNIIFIIAFFSLICFFGMMFNSSGFAFLNTYFQKRVPREYLGRFASARFMFYSILEPLGMNCFGILYSRSNIKYALVLVLVGALTEATLLLRVREKEMNTKISAEALM
ncbi:hypothetical protein REC12_00715 [Desulfosporosinus sp. PR]|uniref:hypothetical protein n=1 Tax=Candidatus Desulfosporosinus nitrosoreducens TaxID=3401928 RepID=UPI0027FF5742|nr:hypothetical protein [Desulfosporosinus sp. PR]MDQ7092110.1 hypothetical protein [Desulfosporosinus sp. PR]